MNVSDYLAQQVDPEYSLASEQVEHFRSGGRTRKGLSVAAVKGFFISNQDKQDPDDPRGLVESKLETVREAFAGVQIASLDGIKDIGQKVFTDYLLPKLKTGGEHRAWLGAFLEM
ncbi:unnamed protein product, partial [Amoebophrya sp. A25]|eukprot:GSA25T00023968001.1